MTADLNAGKSSGCGRICFSLESEPTILDISPEMKRMLGMVEGEEKWLRIFKETPALLLGEAEEKKLKDCLCAVRTAGEPALFEGTFLTVDHQPLPVWGMIDRAGDRDAACFTGTFYDRRSSLRAQADALRDACLRILRSSCDWIGELDLQAGTAQCLYCPRGDASAGIRVSLKDALTFRIRRQVAEGDRERVRAFFVQHLRMDAAACGCPFFDNRNEPRKERRKEK